MQRLTILLSIALGCLLWAAVPAPAATRVALVIGNSVYAHAPQLPNTANDAADMATALRRLGFAVTRADNQGAEALRRSLQTFSRAVATADVAAVFYAGHGLEVDQRNYLVPVDARLARDADVEFETVSLDLVLRAVERARQLRLVILDACRDNPFAARMQRMGATRAIGRGLARVEPSGDTLVAYAAKGGSTAADGTGRNSPYTAALLTHLPEPGQEIGLLFRKVRDTVLAATGGRQEPFVYGSLSSQGFYFVPPQGPSTLSARLGPDPEAEAWAVVKQSQHTEDIQAFLAQYPTGRFAFAARMKLTQMQRPPPEPRGPPGQQVASLLKVCAAHVQANRLTTGAGGSAFDCYRQVLRQEPTNVEAAQGLITIATRYQDWAERAMQRGDTARARTYVAKLKQVHPKHPALAQLEAALALPPVMKSAPATPSSPARGAQVAVGVYERPRPPDPRTLTNSIGMVFVRLPAGEFLMGSPLDEAKRGSDEGPQHRVRISQAFYLGKYEVTQAQWKTVMETNPSRFTGSERPVERVSWEDVQLFIRQLNQREDGTTYRLPTEAEWEYAARAGTTTAYSFGAGREGLERYAWYGENADQQTHPVGQKPPNPWGLYDMHGNVWEWVQDWYGDYGSGTAVDPTGPLSGFHRVNRGGSWSTGAGSCRSANRRRRSPASHGGSLGFRLVRMGP